MIDLVPTVPEPTVPKAKVLEPTVPKPKVRKPKALKPRVRNKTIRFCRIGVIVLLVAHFVLIACHAWHATVHNDHFSLVHGLAYAAITGILIRNLLRKSHK